MTSLGGKVAIITGASSGIGRAIAERLAEDGALVVVNYVMNEEKAQHVGSSRETLLRRLFRSRCRPRLA